MATRTISFRLPAPGLPRAVLETDYGFRGGRLLLDGRPMLALPSREALLEGSSTQVADRPLSLRLVGAPGAEEVELLYDGARVLREDRLRAPTSRSAWIHASIALAASFFGFVAGYLYLRKAQSFEDAWAMKMAIHTAGWHLLLTLTLFPASVWGQRLGIRAVQLMSLLFFCIHVSIALANTDAASTAVDGPWIAFFNALSGLCFGLSVVYGQRAYKDMDPSHALASALALTARSGQGDPAPG